MSMQSKCSRQNAECGIGENSESGIRDKGLGRRVLRLLGRNREIREIYESSGKVTARPLPQPLSIGWRGWPQAGKVTARQEPRPTGRAKLLLSPIQSPVGGFHGQRSSPKQGGSGPPPKRERLPYRFKFLTVRNLLSPSAGRTYDYVSANSLQCGNRGHGSASPPSPSPSDGEGGPTPGKSRLGRSLALPAGAAPTTPHWISCSPVSLPI